MVAGSPGHSPWDGYCPTPMPDPDSAAAGAPLLVAWVKKLARQYSTGQSSKATAGSKSHFRGVTDSSSLLGLLDCQIVKLVHGYDLPRNYPGRCHPRLNSSCTFRCKARRSPASWWDGYQKDQKFTVTGCTPSRGRGPPKAEAPCISQVSGDSGVGMLTVYSVGAAESAALCRLRVFNTRIVTRAPIIRPARYRTVTAGHTDTA